MQPAETLYVDPDTETVGCDGGGGALGHPVVYYTFGTADRVVCGYCSRTFVRRAETAHDKDSAAA